MFDYARHRYGVRFDNEAPEREGGVRRDPGR